MKIIKICLLLVTMLLLSINVNAQKNVQHIYTNFGGWWSSGVGAISATQPNGAHELLGFRIAGSSTVFSTGVNNSILTANGIAFTPTTYHALPVKHIAGSAVSGTYIGIGKNYFSPSTPITGGTLPNSIPYYLTDGVFGLDMGTAIYNIPASDIEYRVSDFNIAAINDGIPDVVATQVGEYTAGRSDKFKFVDVNGNTIGNEISVVFGSVPEVGVQLWAFFDATNNTYANPQPGGTPPVRNTRLLSWDMHDFGLTQTNVGTIDRFVHTLSGVSDAAFMAYNISSFSATTDLTACNNSTAPTLWLQANYATSSVVNATAINSWENRAGGNITRFEQSTAAVQPKYYSGSSTTSFNYNPFISFTNDWMGFAGSALTPTSNLDVFIVAKNNTNGAGGNMLGISADNTLPQNAPGISLDANGNLKFTSSSTTLSSTPNPLQQASLWRLSYTRNGSVEIYRNGVLVNSLVGPYTFDFGTWYSHIGGTSANSFDLAEMILVPGNSTSQEKIRIESSLAIKYGFDLPYNYMSGNAGVIWDRGVHAFNNRIFGIGRENCFGLSQKQSQAESDPLKMVRVGRTSVQATNALNISTMANAEYLMYGDNNGSLANTKRVTLKTKCLLIPDRVWRTQRTGNAINTQVTQVRMRVDNITWNQTLSTNPRDYFLAIDRNSNGVFNDSVDEIITATSLSGGYAVFDNVIWDNEGSGTDLFTIGSTSSFPCTVITNPMIYQRMN
jgi:hypothetical protein